MNSIIIYCRLTSTSWIPCLILSGSDLGWAQVFELVCSVGMVMGVSSGSPIVVSLGMFLVFINRTLVGV